MDCGAYSLLSSESGRGRRTIRSRSRQVEVESGGSMSMSMLLSSPFCKSIVLCMYVCRVRERGRSSAPCSMESGSIPAGVQWFLCCATSCESSCCDGTAKYVAAAAAGTRTYTHSQVTNLECKWEKEST